MRLITRAYLNSLISKQTNVIQERNKDVIEREYGIKPYKREGKSWLYKTSEVLEAGILFQDNLEGFYPIPGFEDKFWISKSALVLNINNMRPVKTCVGSDGYEHITLMFYGKKYRKRVHALMGKVFLGNPQVVNHKDLDKLNNNLSNLERSTHADNVQRAYGNNVSKR